MYEPHMQDFVNNFGPLAQSNALQGMADNAMGAWQQENYSRVAQVEEERRRQHEMELERMRQDSILRQLQMQQQMPSMASGFTKFFPGGSITYS